MHTHAPTHPHMHAHTHTRTHAHTHTSALLSMVLHTVHITTETGVQVSQAINAGSRRPEYIASTKLPANSPFTSSSPLSSFPSSLFFQPLPHSSSSSTSQPASSASLHAPCIRSPVTVTSVDLFLRCLKGPTTSLFIRTRGTSNLGNDARLANGSTYE